MEFRWTPLKERKSKVSDLKGNRPADSIAKSAILSQGKNNKSKWAWVVTANFDRTDKAIIQWYVDVMLAFYSIA